MAIIDINRVTEVLSQVAQGALPAETSHSGACHWTVKAGGLVIVIFDDAHAIDYVEEVRDEKTGRVTTFNSFMNAHGEDPVDRLPVDDRKKLQIRMNGDQLDTQVRSRRR